MDRIRYKMYILVIHINALYMQKTTAQIQSIDPMPSGVGRISHGSVLHHSYGSPPRTLNCYALVYLTRGQGWFQDALGNRQQVRAGQGFLLFSGVEHSYEATNTDGWDEIHLFFEGTTFDLWREAGLLDPARPFFEGSPIDQWTDAFKQIWITASNPLDQVLRLQGFLMNCGLVTSAPHLDKPEHQWLIQARQQLNETLGDPDGVARSAQSFGLSHQTFRKTFRRLQGCPPARYQALQTMTIAAHRLLNETTPIKEIADALGFYDEFHFARRFKQLIGSTPAAYRARLQGPQLKPPSDSTTV